MFLAYFTTNRTWSPNYSVLVDYEVHDLCRKTLKQLYLTTSIPAMLKHSSQPIQDVLKPGFLTTGNYSHSESSFLDYRHSIPAVLKHSFLDTTHSRPAKTSVFSSEQFQL
jgi:hypothetical protein